MLIFFALISTSSWLKGRAWFIATLIVLAASLASFEWGDPLLNSRVEIWLARAMLVYVFFGVSYVIGGRYITKTEVLDITYQSHEELVRFIDESGDTSPFARFMRNMGPVLFAVLLIFGAVLVWAKFTGVVA